jgi:hypothetical protein
MKSLPMHQWEVRALLEGRLGQFRRVINIDEFQASTTTGYDFSFRKNGLWQDVRIKDMLNPPRKNYPFKCPFGVVGDRLWVRETFRIFNSLDECSHYDPCSCGQYNGKPIYRADCDDESKWKPSIYMPRWASRLTLEITNIRVERLQEITEEDVKAEGLLDSNGIHLSECFLAGRGMTDRCDCGDCSDKEHFEKLWDSINKDRAPWASNPWVWVLEFRTCKE